MTSPADEALERIALGLIDKTLPKSEWTHAAHFAAVLWLIRRQPDLDLPVELPGIIRAYNEASGGRNTETEGYHETITQVSIAAARAFHDARPEEPLNHVLSALMASPLGRPDWNLSYWSPERLFSIQARRRWTEPDIAPLPSSYAVSKTK